MKDNLENKVDKITKVIGSIQTDKLATKEDLNGAFNELIKSLESVNIKTNEEFAKKFVEAFQASMDEKHKNLQSILNDFEKQVFELPKGDDSKFDYEITKITSDVNAIYSKIEDQEKQFSKLIKALENFSKKDTKKDFESLKEDLDSFAKGFGTSANTLIKHFNDFMDNLKEYSGKEEFNKLFDNLEILSNNTSLIISAIGIIDSKYKDMTDVVELITNNENAFGRTLEELRESKTAFDNFVPELKHLSTKEDMDIIHKQLDILNEAFIETKKYIEAQKDNSDAMKVEEKQKEIVSGLETLQSNLLTLNTNLISLGESCTNNFSSEEDEIKDSFSKISKKIDEIVSDNKTLFDEGISNKLSSFEENINKTNQENYIKIYNQLNESIESFENKIKDKKNENKDAILNSVNSIQEQIGTIIDSIKIFKEDIKTLNDDFEKSCKEPVEKILDSVESSNIEMRINELSSTLSQTIDDFKDAFDNLGDKMVTASAGSNFETIEKINETSLEVINNIESLKEEILAKNEETRKEFKEEAENAVLEIKDFINDILNASQKTENKAEKELKNSFEMLNDAIVSLEEGISKIGDKDFFKEVIDEINTKNEENLQNLSDAITENIENIGLNASREFINQKEIINGIITKIIETSAGHGAKLDVINEKIADESARITNTITSNILQNSDTNNALMSDALSGVLNKLIDIQDITNTNLNKIEEKIASIPQDLNDGQVTILTEEFGNMTNKLEQINLQQINNSKELMIELQNIIGEEEEKKEVLSKLVLNTNILKEFEEKIEQVNIKNAELSQSIEEKIESINESNEKNTRTILDEVHTTNLKQLSENDDSKKIINDIKENLNTYAQDIKTNIQDYVNDINLKNEQAEVFQNNLSEQLQNLFEKQTRIFSSAFSKTLSAQNPKDFSLALEKIYSKLNTISNTPKSENDEYDYTLKDVESDLAKVRLILEKNPNVEVTQHLSALRSTINDTVKVNQNVDQQLSYVNNWLRTAAKTMEILARKIDKAEKSNSDLAELKEFLANRPLPIQNAQADTTDIEHQIANTSKKFKIQEMKLESIEDKLNAIIQKTGEEPDIKGFINVLYENMAQTKTLNTRMDSIETQLNGLQRNMERIISYIEE